MNLEKFEYILRYCLPTLPHFDEAYTEKRFQQLLAFCEETGIKAVMLFVSLDPNFYYMPDTLEHTKLTRDILMPYIKKLKEKNISVQLNYQNLLGSVSGAADFSKKLGYEPIVDYKGYSAGGVACPLGKRFREIASKKLKIWAETKPDIFWIDDDLRMHNHGSNHFAKLVGEGNYVEYYCFCKEHIRRFNEKLGKNYTREEIVSGILREGEPSQMRQDYLTFINESVVDTAKWIEQTIHSVDKDIRIAQMTSVPDVHSAEWRSWKDFYNALCGEHTPIVRPHFGPYREPSPRNFIVCYKALAQSMCNMQESCDKEIDFYPEVENTRYTVWAKSGRATAFQLELAAFMGCNKITLALHDLDGGMLDDEPCYKELLKKEKSYLDDISALPLRDSRNLGVIIPTTENAGLRYHLRKGENYTHMSGEIRYIENYFLQMGIPCQYKAVKDLDGTGVTALDGYTANILTDQELKVLLKGSVFLEGDAVEILLERGFGKEIGVEKLQKPTTQTNVEIIKSFVRNDGTHIRIPSRIPYQNWHISTLASETHILSMFSTPMGEEYPALTFFENAYGGKIAIYFAGRNWGDAFFTHHRVTLFKNVLQKLDKNLDRIDAHAYILACVRKTEKKEKYYFIANLATDRLDTVTINGKTVQCGLEVYESAVFEESDGCIQRKSATRKGRNI